MKLQVWVDHVVSMKKIYMYRKIYIHKTWTTIIFKGGIMKFLNFSFSCLTWLATVCAMKILLLE